MAGPDLKKLAKDTATAADKDKLGLSGVEQTNDPSASSVISQEISDDTRKVGMGTGYGDFTQAITRAYFGYNHRGTGSPIESNTDQYGLVFFTRPSLNLSYDNIANDRTFAPLLTDKVYSTQRAIRAYLDPVGSRPNENAGNYHTPLVDPENPFITLLSNTLISINGWPDPYVETYVSNEGRYKEQWGMIDGPAKIYNSYTLNATFRNIVQDPISSLFNVWTQYGSRVYEGFFDPRPNMILENTIDYHTRIWRLVLDKSRRVVQSIGCCGAGFPTANNMGAKFNFNTDKPYNQELDQISVSFLCFGAIYQDPILVEEFNRTVSYFNALMGDDAKGGGSIREANFHQLSMAELPVFNYYGYPRIDPDTMELQWWVKLEDYYSVLGLSDPRSASDIAKAINKVNQVKEILQNPVAAFKR